MLACSYSCTHTHQYTHTQTQTVTAISVLHVARVLVPLMVAMLHFSAMPFQLPKRHFPSPSTYSLPPAPYLYLYLIAASLYLQIVMNNL